MRQTFEPEIASLVRSELKDCIRLIFMFSDLLVKLRLKDLDELVALRLPDGIRCTRVTAVGRIVAGSVGGTIKPSGTA